MSTVIRTSMPSDLNIPRMVTAKKGFGHYEFRSFKDLRTCLENGSFILGIKVKQVDSSRSEGGKLTVYETVGNYGNQGDYSVYVALQGDSLTEKEYKGKSSLYYDLLNPETSKNYEVRKTIEDTVEDVSACMEFARPLLNAIRIEKYPELPCTLHVPNQLKFAKPKKRNHANGEVTECDVDTIVNRTGLLMIQFGIPWWMKMEKPQVTVLMGIQMVLSNLKYLSNDELTQVKKEAAEATVKRVIRKRSAPVEEEGEEKKVKTEQASSSSGSA